MTPEEAIKRTSEFLQKIFHDDKDSLEQLRKMEEKKDVVFYIAALEQLRLSCVGLKQIISNQITNIFTDKCSVTMPAENYLFIYKRIQELEKERDCYKQQLDILKKAAKTWKCDNIRSK